MIAKIKIGKLIQKRRKELRVTQGQLAEVAEVSINTLYKIERGQANPTLDSLQKIADVLGLEVTLKLKDN